MSDPLWLPGNVIMLLGAAMAVLLAILSWRKPVPGCKWFALSMLAMAECEGFWAAENLATGMSAKVKYAKLEYLGISTAALLTYLFVSVYSGQRRQKSRLGFALLWIVPVVVFLLALTNEHHQLIWSHIAPSSTDASAPLVYTLGPAAVLLVAYNYVLMAYTVLIALRSARHAQRVFHRQAALIAVAIALPLAGSIVYLFRLGPSPGIDLLPLTLTISGGLVYLAVFRFRFLDLVPVARATLVESMVDGVLVLDARNRIVDSNPAAQRLLSVAGQQLTGIGVRDVLGDASILRTALDAVSSVGVEMCSPSDERVHLEVQVVPLSARGAVGGTLLVLRDVTAKWLVEEELRAQLDRNVALQEKLREEAIRDSLTGTFNRRMLQEAVAREVALARRDDTSVGLIVIDLDHFKVINDRHGHQAGDSVLQAVAALLQSGTRASDVVCRYGGEEFVVIMPRATTSDAIRRAEQWRRGVESLRIEYEGACLQVTLSAGVAAFPATGSDMDDVFRAADRALFEAKRAGRNQVCRAQGAPAPVG